MVECISATDLDNVSLCMALITLEMLKVGSFLVPTLSFLPSVCSSDRLPPESWVMNYNFPCIFALLLLLLVKGLVILLVGEGNMVAISSFPFFGEQNQARFSDLVSDI